VWHAFYAFSSASANSIFWAYESTNIMMDRGMHGIWCTYIDRIWEDGWICTQVYGKSAIGSGEVTYDGRESALRPFAKAYLSTCVLYL
jgi:hypothetical protein